MYRLLEYVDNVTAGQSTLLYFKLPGHEFLRFIDF